MTNRFGPQDYTADGMLRVGWLLWLILAFLARHWILLVLGAVSSFVGVRSAPNAGAAPGLLSGPWFLLASLPAVALLGAALRRRPAAGRLVRVLWRHGRWLLLSSALVDFALLAGLGYGHLDRLNELHIIGALLDLYILAYLLRSRRVGLRFADSPAPDRGDGPPRRSP